MIYFLKANDKVKIGYADDPSKRIPGIQTSSPFEIEVLLIIDGNYDKESELHKRFQKHRTSGEWFDLERPIQSFIEENLEFDRKYEFGFVIEDFAGNEQILRLRKRHKLSLKALAEKLNIASPSLKEIQDREKTGSLTIKKLKNVADVLVTKGFGKSYFTWGSVSFTKQSEARTKYLAALRDADRNDYNSLIEFSRL